MLESSMIIGGIPVGVLRETTACAGDATPSALVTRRSIRKYLDTPVSDDLVQQVLVEARWAPSCSNSQSTLVYVLSGKPFEDFKAELRKLSLVNVPAESDVPIGGPWTPAQEVRTQVFKEFRSVWCAAEEQRLGIEPEPAPANPLVAGAAVHGAPLLLVLAFDKAVSVNTGCFDSGLFAMAITLAAQQRGLGTCIVANPIRYSDLMHKYIPGLQDKKVVMGIAMGYPDADAIINRFPRSRMTPEGYIAFVR
jgi:nitroreductase